MRIPRSHSITASLPSLRMYSAAISSSSSVLESPRLSSTGQPRAPDLRQQRVVLHVAGADLDHVGDLEHLLEIAQVHQLGHDRQPSLLLGLLQQPQTLLTEALERVRRGAGLVGAAAEHRGAGVARPRARSSASARAIRPCTGPAMIAKCSPPSLRPPISSTVRSAALDLRRGELVGLHDRHHPVDAGRALEVEPLVCSQVADRADHGQLLAVASGVRARRRSATRSMTACTSCSVAVAFITIIICLIPFYAWKLYGRVGPRVRARYGARPPDGPARFAGARGARPSA